LGYDCYTYFGYTLGENSKVTRQRWMWGRAAMFLEGATTSGRLRSAEKSIRVLIIPWSQVRILVGPFCWKMRGEK
jgi:hypothetical protein